jgi:putative endonuclease
LNKTEKGKLGEKIALDYLVSKGFSILHQNYRFSHSEIDFICIKDNTLIFIEVKYRTSLEFGYPEQAINSNKINKIKKASENFIFEYNWTGSIRFDVLAITQLEELEIYHIEDAF